MNTDEARKLAVEAKARADAATPGPWKQGDRNPPAYFWDGIVYVDGKFTQKVLLEANTNFADEGSNNCEFIAHSRQDVPALADALIAALNEVERLTAPVTWRQLDYEDGDTWECSGCQKMTVWEDSPEEYDVKFCSGCGHPVIFEYYQDPFNDYDESWDDTP